MLSTGDIIMSRRLTKTEFMLRNEEILEARKMFIPHQTQNITTAYEMYKEIMDWHDRPPLPVSITKDQKFLKDWQKVPRPKCPECDVELFIKKISTPPGPANKNAYQSLWYCPICIHEEYSTQTVEEVMGELQEKYDMNAPDLAQKLIDQQTILEDLIMPKCPQCETDLKLIKINIPKGLSNKYGYRTVWQCSSCAFEEFKLTTYTSELLKLERKDAGRQPDSN
jgi:uncharacterized protein with PIN domain